MMQAVSQGPIAARELFQMHGNDSKQVHLVHRAAKLRAKLYIRDRERIVGTDKNLAYLFDRLIDLELRKNRIKESRKSTARANRAHKMVSYGMRALSLALLVATVALQFFPQVKQEVDALSLIPMVTMFGGAIFEAINADKAEKDHVQNKQSEKHRVCSDRLAILMEIEGRLHLPNFV